MSGGLKFGTPSLLFFLVGVVATPQALAADLVAEPPDTPDDLDELVARAREELLTPKSKAGDPAEGLLEGQEDPPPEKQQADPEFPGTIDVNREAESVPWNKCNGCTPGPEDLEQLKAEYEALRASYRQAGAFASEKGDGSSAAPPEPTVDPVYAPGFAGSGPFLALAALLGFAAWRRKRD